MAVRFFEFCSLSSAGFWYGTPQYLYPNNNPYSTIDNPRPTDEIIIIQDSERGIYSGVYPCLCDNGVKYRLAYFNYMEGDNGNISEADAVTYQSILDTFEGYADNKLVWVFDSGNDLPVDYQVGDYLFIYGQESDYPYQYLKIIGYGIDVSTNNLVLMMDVDYVAAGISGATLFVLSYIRYNKRIPVELWLKDEILDTVNDYYDGAYKYKTLYVYPQFNSQYALNSFNYQNSNNMQWLYVDIAEPCREKLLSFRNSSFTSPADGQPFQEWRSGDAPSAPSVKPVYMVYAILKTLYYDSFSLPAYWQFQGDDTVSKGWSAVMYAKTFATNINSMNSSALTAINPPDSYFPIIQSPAKVTNTDYAGTSGAIASGALTTNALTTWDKVYSFISLTSNSLFDDYCFFPVIWESQVTVNNLGTDVTVPTVGTAFIYFEEGYQPSNISYNQNAMAVVWINKYGVPTYWVFNTETPFITEYENGETMQGYLNNGEYQYSGVYSINKPEKYFVRQSGFFPIEMRPIFEDLLQATQVLCRPFVNRDGGGGLFWYDLNTYNANLCRIENASIVSSKASQHTIDIEFDLVLQPRRVEQLR